MFLTALQLLVLVVVQEAVFDQRAHGADPEMALGYPADGMDIPQPAGAFLYVRLQVVDGVVETLIAVGITSFEDCPLLT